MIWMAALMAAKAYQEGQQVKAQAKIDKVVAKSNTKVQNINMATENILSKAKGDMARYQQARSNKYKVEAGADSVAAQRTNLLRLADASARGSFDNRIAAAEMSGAMAAQAGAAAIGGGSLDMLNASTTIRNQRVQEIADRQLETSLYDGERNIDQTIEATILGMDDIQFNDSVNYQEAQTPYIKEPSWTEIGMNAGMQFATTYASMGGFDKLGAKLPTWLGGTPAPSFGTQAGRAITTQLK